MLTLNDLSDCKVVEGKWVKNQGHQKLSRYDNQNEISLSAKLCHDFSLDVWSTHPQVDLKWLFASKSLISQK